MLWNVVILDCDISTVTTCLYLVPIMMLEKRKETMLVWNFSAAYDKATALHDTEIYPVECKMFEKPTFMTICSSCFTWTVTQYFDSWTPGLTFVTKPTDSHSTPIQVCHVSVKYDIYVYNLAKCVKIWYFKTSLINKTYQKIPQGEGPGNSNQTEDF